MREQPLLNIKHAYLRTHFKLKNKNETLYNYNVSWTHCEIRQLGLLLVQTALLITQQLESAEKEGAHRFVNKLDA